MFLKSVYPIIFSSLEIVLDRYGLLDDDIISILKDMKNNIGQTINVDTGGGGIWGSVIGGLNNSIKG